MTYYEDAFADKLDILRGTYKPPADVTADPVVSQLIAYMLQPDPTLRPRAVDVVAEVRKLGWGRFLSKNAPQGLAGLGRAAPLCPLPRERQGLTPVTMRPAPRRGAVTCLPRGCCCCTKRAENTIDAAKINKPLPVPQPSAGAGWGAAPAPSPVKAAAAPAPVLTRLGSTILLDSSSVSLNSSNTPVTPQAPPPSTAGATASMAAGAPRKPSVKPDVPEPTLLPGAAPAKSATEIGLVCAVRVCAGSGEVEVIRLIRRWRGGGGIGSRKGFFILLQSCPQHTGRDHGCRASPSVWARRVAWPW